jgi:LPXTG-motif cell wall-anchored protein
MKRTMLALLGVLLLSVAGSAIAQTDYGSNDQSSPNQPATTSTSDSTVSSTGSTSDDPSGATASTVQGATADPAPSSGTHKGSLPKTASSDPLALALGLTALGSAVGLHLYRRRTAH